MTMNNQFDVTYFIHKFSAIPDEWWGAGFYGDDFSPRCAVGHCGGRHDNMLSLLAPEPTALGLILPEVTHINDGDDKRYQQPTPKARILAALHDAKARAEAALEAYELRELTLTPAKEQVSA